MDQHAVEVNKGRRFEFGTNWMCFLKVLNDDRINEAKKSLQKMLERENLNGKTFLDIGSGNKKRYANNPCHFIPFYRRGRTGSVNHGELLGNKGVVCNAVDIG